MSTFGTNTRGSDKENSRSLNFNQTSVNPATSNPGNPFGNTVRVQFPYPQSFSASEVALAHLYLWFSWYNISAAFNNNKFSYTFPTASGQLTFNVTIPDGYYSIDELSQFLDLIMVNNGTYLVGAGGLPVYYISFTANDTYYRTTIFLDLVPDPAEAAAGGLTVPANYPGGGLPAVATTPQLIVPATLSPAGSTIPGLYSFSSFLGYTPGTYPPAPAAVTTSYNGQFAPVVESTNSVNVAATFCNNGTLNINSRVFYQFSAGDVSFGSQIVVEPRFPIYTPVADGFYNYIDIQLLDDNNNPLQLQDPHITGSLLIRGR
jgi:hypothetical protein